jgi:predicted Zn-dependent protease
MRPVIGCFLAVVFAVLTPSSMRGQTAIVLLAESGVPAQSERGVPEGHKTKQEKRRKLSPKYDINRIGNRGVGRGINIYSVEKEQRLGQELAKAIEQDSKFLDDDVVVHYVSLLTENIVRHSDATIPFTVRVLDNDELNAFALPGGYLYVNSGLIAATQNEAELAGVIAHEIAHVAARHVTKSETKGLFLALATIPLVFVPAGGIVRQVAVIAGPFSSSRFSGKAELEADLLGMEYAFSAGYDPTCLVQLFERVNADQRVSRSRLARIFSTHPLTSDRIIAAQTVIADYLADRETYLVSTSEFDNIRERLLTRQSGARLGGSSKGPVLHRKTQSNPRSGKPEEIEHGSEMHIE